MRDLLESRGTEVKPLEYLLLWLGIVGNCVGLAIPLKIMKQMR